jgi:hypothetical protein
MHHRDRVIWDKPEIEFMNVSTQMVILKNDPDRHAKWAPHPWMAGGQGGDFIFIAETAALWPPEAIFFGEEIIATLTEHSLGAPAIK